MQAKHHSRSKQKEVAVVRGGSIHVELCRSWQLVRRWKQMRVGHRSMLALAFLAQAMLSLLLHLLAERRHDLH